MEIRSKGSTLVPLSKTSLGIHDNRTIEIESATSDVKKRDLLKGQQILLLLRVSIARDSIDK